VRCRTIFTLIFLPFVIIAGLMAWNEAERREYQERRRAEREAFIMARPLCLMGTCDHHEHDIENCAVATWDACYEGQCNDNCPDHGDPYEDYDHSDYGD
jgi:hypothetical protein